MNSTSYANPQYVVTAARLGAWQRYQSECNGYDIEPGQYLPLRGADIYSQAANGAAQVLRNLVASGKRRAQRLVDDRGNEYEFEIKGDVPLGNSLLHNASNQRLMTIPVAGEEGAYHDSQVKLVSRANGMDNMGPVLIKVHDCQNVEDCLESMEWRAVLALTPGAVRIRTYVFRGRGRTIMDPEGKRTQKWRLYNVDIQDQYPYEGMDHHVTEAVRLYLDHPHNARASAAAAIRAKS